MRTPRKSAEPPQPDGERLKLLDDTPEVREAQIRVAQAMKRAGYPEAACFGVRLAFEEAVLNALRHGHAQRPGTPVDVEWNVSPERVQIVVKDQGPGFNPDALPDPTLPENLERPTGRGVLLMRAYMTRVQYSTKGNEVVMELDRQPA